MSADSNRQIITDIKGGDKVAMEKFFRRHAPYMYSVALRYITDCSVASDILHDAFIKIFSAIKNFKIDCNSTDSEITKSLKSWSARIVANTALNYLRDNSRVKFVAIEEAPLFDLPDDEVDVESLTWENITGLIEELPMNYRTVFNLYAIEGYSHKEIAKMLGISESASAVQYHRAKAALKKMILQFMSR